jgi:hypothetical protein
MAKIEWVREGLEVKTDAMRTGLEGKIDAVRKNRDDVKQSVAEIIVSIESLRVWALRLYIGLAASLLLVLAHGFKSL